MEGVLNWLVGAIPLGIMALGAGMAMAIPFMPRDAGSQGRSQGRSQEGASRASATADDGGGEDGGDEALGFHLGDEAVKRLLEDEEGDDLLDGEETERLPVARVILLWDATTGVYRQERQDRQDANPARPLGALRVGAPAPSAFVATPTQGLISAMMHDDWRRMWRTHPWAVRRKALTDGVMYTQRFRLMVADTLHWPATN